MEYFSHNEIEKVTFDAFFDSIPRSNLLQASYYGDAKGRVENLDIRRFLVKGPNEPVAIYQALIKKLPALGHTVRINRGPIFLKESQNKIENVFRSFHDEWFIKKGFHILMVPFLYDNSLTAGRLCEPGLFNRNDNVKWCSGWLSLERSEEELRRGLLQKWRNMLNKSERMGLEIVECKSSTEFDKLLSEYEGFKQKKKFASVSDVLIRSLYEESPCSLLALTARKNGNNVGSLITARHGGSATYLVGFTNSMGRKTNANYLLLWKAILNCMGAGVKWFDVGGIDENNTPGIAHFKKGLGVEQYSLIGEYSACKGIRGTAISLLRKLKT